MVQASAEAAESVAVRVLVQIVSGSTSRNPLAVSLSVPYFASVALVRFRRPSFYGPLFRLQYVQSQPASHLRVVQASTLRHRSPNAEFEPHHAAVQSQLAFPAADHLLIPGLARQLTRALLLLERCIMPPHAARLQRSVASHRFIPAPDLSRFFRLRAGPSPLPQHVLPRKSPFSPRDRFPPPVDPAAALCCLQMIFRRS